MSRLKPPLKYAVEIVCAIGKQLKGKDSFFMEHLSKQYEERDQQGEFPYRLAKCRKCEMVGYFNPDTHRCPENTIGKKKLKKGR